jgi:hypothetical protein
VNIFSSIIVIYCNISSTIVRVWDNESLISSELILMGECFFVNYRFLLNIIVNYCPGERQRISDLIINALKGWIFFVIYCELSSIFVRVIDNESLISSDMILKCESFSSIIVIYCKLSSTIVRVSENKHLQNIIFFAKII